MIITNHMLLDDGIIKQDKRWVGKITKEIKGPSERCHVLSDPTRIKILLLIRKHKELCVSDLAEILNVSISAVSHQLNLLEQLDIVANKKMGKVVCYSLRIKNNPILKCLDFNWSSTKLNYFLSERERK